MTVTSADRLMAYLVAPDVAPRPSPDALPTPQEFLALVERHKLPLYEVLTVNHLLDAPLVATPAVQAALGQDRELHRSIYEEFEAIRPQLEAAGIPYVLLKGVNQMPYRSDNIDILLHEKDFEPVGGMLEALGYMENLYSTNRHKNLYNRVSGCRRSGIFHFHRYVAWYSPFVEPDYIFPTAVEGGEPGVRLPRTEVSMGILGAHAMYEDACVRFIEMHKIRHLMSRGPVDWNDLWQMARHRGFASGLALFFLILDGQHRLYMGRPMFDDAQRRTLESHLDILNGTEAHYRRHVAGRDLPCPYAMSKYFARRLLLCQLFGTRIATRREKLAIAATILSKGWEQVTRRFPQPPTTVAVCGWDGCGKTTIIDCLSRGIGTFDVHSERSWKRIGDSPLLNLLKRPLRRHIKAEVDAGIASEQGVFQSAFLRRLWPVLAVPDYVFRQYLAIGWAYVRHRMAIADRYHVDAMVDLALRCGPEVFEKRWVVWMLRLLPRARPAFILECSPETLRRRRRKEFFDGVSERVIGYYRKAAELFGATIISNEGDPSVAAEQMIREVITQFFKRL